MKIITHKAIPILMFALFGLSNVANSQTFEWANNFSGSGIDAVNSVKVDALGNVYTTGTFRGTVDFDPGAGTFNLTTAGVDDIFISKLDVAGNFVWAIQMGESSYDAAYSIALDNFGNVYTTGYFKGTMDFDPGAGIFNLTAAPTANDIFISKLDAAGNFVWAKQMAGDNPSLGSSITLDASGNIYTTGGFRGIADFDPGAGTFNLSCASFSDHNIFISKLDSAGNFVWAKQMSGVDLQRGNSVTVDALGNVYTTGFFNGVADFDPGVGTFDLTSAGSYEIFISKFDSAGNFVWAKQMGGAGTDNSYSIILDSSENIYVTGSFTGTSDFDPGVGTFNLTSNGTNSDIFIAKLDTAGNFVWAKQVGGTGTDLSNTISLDVSGNIYTTGYFRGTVDFDPGSGTFDLNSAGSDEVFISKYDSAGNFVWANDIGGADSDKGVSIAIDAAENIYAAGNFKGTADFDPGTGNFDLTSGGDYDVFILKLGAGTTGISGEFKNSDFKIYPNPTNGILHFSGSANAQLVNLAGQIVAARKNVNKLDLSEQATGVYFLVLTNTNGEVIQRSKIVKQ